MLDFPPESVQPFAEQILAKTGSAEHFCPNRPTAAGNIRDDDALLAFRDFRT